MAILIDGYNLLHATGYIAAGAAYDSLEGPRRNFLQFLVERLTHVEAGETTVVFDAANAPPGLPTQVSFGRIQVLFAHNHAEADDLIEELIQADNVPQKLTVVSSDHRIHRAARRRRAKVVDSDQWYWEIHDRPTVDEITEADVSRDIKLNDDEVASWVELFGEVDESGFERRSKTANRPRPLAEIPSPDEPKPKVPPTRASASEIPVIETPVTKAPITKDNERSHKEGKSNENPFPDRYGEDIINDLAEGEDIFPPGYGEDLLEDKDT